MRYIGGKGLLLDFIDRAIAENTQDVRTVMDNFRRFGYRIVASQRMRLQCNIQRYSLLQLCVVARDSSVWRETAV